MAREWSLQETRVLVEEHIALKEEEKLESRTASEHWNIIAKRLRERGFYRSYKSCNKRWYRLEQYEVQIFSFNMEEGKNKNFWDLTKSERLEFRDRWPQLPSGDGIDKEMFDLLKIFSHQYEKKDKLDSTNVSTSSADNKEVTHENSNIDTNRQTFPLLQPLSVSPLLTPRISTHTTGANGDQDKLDEDLDVQSQKKPKSNWSVTSEQPTLSSQGPLDGFKLQARELRKRHAIEFRKNNRTGPYSSTHTTFMKGVQPFPSQNLPSTNDTTTFGSITMIPPPENIMQQQHPSDDLLKPHPKDSVTQTKPPIHFKRLFNPSPKLDLNEYKSKNNNIVPNIQQPIGSHLNFQSQSSRPTCNGKPLLHSINSHLPLLQPKDNHFKDDANLDDHHQSAMDSSNFPHKPFHMDSLEKQLQVILGMPCNPLHSSQTCEQQLHKNIDNLMNYQPSKNQSAAATNLLGVTIGGLGVQLGAIVTLLQAKHAAEQGFQAKILQLAESMVVSLRNMA